MTYSEQYKEHITPKYDAQFKMDPNLKWDPFVGKAYDQTGILIIGNSTYALDDTDWGPKWREYTESYRDANRILVFDEDVECQHKPFRVTSEMFICAADKEPTNKAVCMFWESVAFHNFCQSVVSEQNSPCGCNDQSIKALSATIDILKPKLVLVWGTELGKKGLNGYRDCEKICGDIPRVIDEPTPIVGVKHPSMAFNPNEWYKFLQNDSATNERITDFVSYLKQSIN